MMDDFMKAKELLTSFKGDSYIFGSGVLSDVGKQVKSAGQTAIMVNDFFPGAEDFVDTIVESLNRADVDLIKTVKGAKPNCPREDLFRITNILKTENPDVIISFGGGSTIDAVKAAEVLRTLGGDIEDYFGVSLVTAEIKRSGKPLKTHVAIQTASSSAAHLTKYANITDLSTGQKKLIVDEAIVPAYPVFDYKVTYQAPQHLTVDGSLDGLAHCLEVFYGSTDSGDYQKMACVTETAIRLIIEYLPRVIAEPLDQLGREALCLATDLGGLAIMTGGTNGAHLTSFSFVDLLSHGRACGVMNPYYTVLFANAIEPQLKLIAKTFKETGLTHVVPENLCARDLAIAVAEAMLEFSQNIGVPTRLSQIEGFSQAHIDRALTAAKNPQLRMKLQNMPVPMTPEMVDEYMGSLLYAARDGDLSKIKSL